MKKILILFLILIISATSSYAETLVCKPLQGVMTTANKKTFSKVNGKGQIFVKILNNKVVVSNDSDNIEYIIEQNNDEVLHFYNITQYVFDAFSYYKKTGILYYSKHSNFITNYATLYKTTCEDENR